MKNKKMKNKFARINEYMKYKQPQELTELQTIFVLAVTMHIIRGKLGFTVNSKDSEVLFKSTAIQEALVLNTGGYYTPAFGQMALLGTCITTFSNSINNVNLGVLGAEGAKNTAKVNLMKVLKKALAYVNGLAEDDQANAVEIITGAKMVVIGVPSINKQDFAIKQGPGTGEVILTSLAVKVDGKYVKAVYEWQFSIDNGKTWEPLPVTTTAKTMATGMLPGIATLFRKRTSSAKTGVSTWSPAIEIHPM